MTKTEAMQNALGTICVAEIEKFRHGFVDGTSMDVIKIEDTNCVNVVWEWQ